MRARRAEVERARAELSAAPAPPTVADAKRRLRALATGKTGSASARLGRRTVAAGVALGVVGIGALALTLKASPTLLRWAWKGLARSALQAVRRSLTR